MAENNFLSHIGSDGSRPSERAERYGFTGPRGAAGNLMVGEMAGGTSMGRSAQSSINSWYNSPAGHRRQLMSVTQGPQYAGVGLWFDEYGGGRRTMKFGIGH